MPRIRAGGLPIRPDPATQRHVEAISLLIFADEFVPRI